MDKNIGLTYGQLEKLKGLEQNTFMSDNPEMFGLKLGDMVTWRYEFRGGYGRVVFLKAKVVKLTPKKCTLESRRIRGGIKNTSVLYENIKESTQYKKMLTSAGLV